MASAAGLESAYRIGNRKASEDAYCARSNPDGIVGLGLAENGVAYHSGGWGESIHRSTQRLAEAGAFTDARARYPSWQGLPGLRQGLARLMSCVGFSNTQGSPPDSDDLVVFCGATAAVEAVAFALCDPGDGILVPAPYYASFDVDLGLRARCVPVPVPAGSGRAWRAPTLDAFDAAFEEASSCTGRPPRVLLLCSPNNPTGVVYSAAEIEEMCEWAVGKGMHVVSDEVYAGTEEAGEGLLHQGFTSAASAVPPGSESRVHVIYGLSKVAGVPGLRAACIWTLNARVKDALSASGRFASLPSDTQLVLADVLRDRVHVQSLVALSRQALSDRRRDALAAVRGFLEGCGVPCVVPDAGVYLWARLADADDAVDLALFEDCLQGGVCVTPGQAFHSPEPGWFRICFAAGGEDETRLGLGRLDAALCARQGQGGRVR